MFRHPTAVPVYRSDIYSRAALLDPYPHYRALRDLGSVVWLARHRLYAVPRYAECKETLRDDGRYLSGHGVAANPWANRLSRGTTLNSDGADHDRRRKLVAHRLMPRALRTLGDDVDARARALVDDAVRRGTVDAVADLATALPLAAVPDLVGWPPDERGDLLHWAAATFDILGPANWQALKALPRSLHMLRFARRVVRERNVLPGSLAAELLTAVDEGGLAAEEGNNAGRHVGFGSGAHACAGQGLARLETTAMLQALIERIDRIEIVAEPTWAVNNIIRRHEHLPVKLIPAT